MPLRLKKRGEIWHYSGTVNGRRIRGSTKTAIKSEAERVAHDRETLEFEGDRDPGAILTFADAAIEYRKVKGTPRFLTFVEDYWKDTLVRDISSGAVKRAAIELMPGAKGSSRNRAVIAPTQAVINYAATLDLCPRIKVDRFPVVKVRKEPVTWDWVQAFMAHSSPHLGGLACFMFLTGARVSEALDVRWQDLDMAAATVIIRMGKLGGEERTAHLPAELVAAIANIPGERKPTGRVFFYGNYRSLEQAWNNAAKRAGVKPLGRHACRHGFATGLLHAGVDPVTVAEQGGWKTPALVLSTYGHSTGEKRVTELLIGTPVAHDADDAPQAIEKSA